MEPQGSLGYSPRLGRLSGLLILTLLSLLSFFGLVFGADFSYSGIFNSFTQSRDLEECVTPSVLLPHPRSAYPPCMNEYSIASLTDDEWMNLKWGAIDVMCRSDTHSLVFFLKTYPRFSANPITFVTSAARRVAGSVDIRTVTRSVGSLCECDPSQPRRFYAEVHEKEQFIVGVKVQSTPRRFYEFYGRNTPCDPPSVWTPPSSAGLPPFRGIGSPPTTANHHPLSQQSRFYAFEELGSCYWRVELPSVPRIFGTRNKIFIRMVEGEVSGFGGGGSDAIGGITSADVSREAGNTLFLKLPPNCRMNNVPKEFRVWIRDLPAAAAAAGAAAAGAAAAGAAAAAAAARAAPGFGVFEQQQPQQPQAVEVYLQIQKKEAPPAESCYYVRLQTVADFDLAVKRLL